MKLLKLSATALILVAGTASAAITGSGHDFSDDGWGTTEICQACHAPHDNQNATGALLWNHDPSAVETYGIYSSTTFTTGGQPDGSSKLCLSCHDGTVALDAFNGSADVGTLIGAYNGGGGDMGTDLSNDHPVSFTYTTATATADGELSNPSVALSGMAGGGTIAADMLEADKMQCSSCHDVHNTYNLAGLLKVSNAASALCLTCHTK